MHKFSIVFNQEPLLFFLGKTPNDFSCVYERIILLKTVPGKCFLVGVFEENARLLQWLVFFVSSTRSVHFFVHLFNIINLNYGCSKHTGNVRTSSKTKKNKTDSQNLENILRIPLRLSWCFSLHGDFFGHYQTFESFWIAPKGPFIF